MSTDFANTATTVEELAVGAAKTAAEVAGDPVGAARKQVKSLERKGAPTVRRLNRQLNALIPDRLEVFGVQVDGQLPERMAIRGLRLVRVQARRQDAVGRIATRTLRVFNAAFKTVARTATRLEQASEPNAGRQAERRPVSRRARIRSARRRAA